LLTESLHTIVCQDLLFIQVGKIDTRKMPHAGMQDSREDHSQHVHDEKPTGSPGGHMLCSQTLGALMLQY
jgi:hypothetical protein